MRLLPFWTFTCLTTLWFSVWFLTSIKCMIVLKTGEMATISLVRDKPGCRLGIDSYEIIKREDMDKNDEKEVNFYAIQGKELEELVEDDETKKIGGEDDDVYNREDRYKNQLGRITCKPGWIEYVRVNDNAQGCGLGTVLTEMCMIDPVLTRNDVKSNLVYKKLKANFKKEGRQEAFSHLETRCNSLIGLEMAAKPVKGPDGDDVHAGAFAYFKAAMQMNYHFMVVEDGPNAPNYKKLAAKKDPPESECEKTIRYYPVEDAKKLYSSATGDIEGFKGSGQKAKWYFCKESGGQMSQLPPRTKIKVRAALAKRTKMKLRLMKNILRKQ